MTRLVLICSFAALTGCAAHRTPYPIVDSWAVVQHLPPGTEVVVRVPGVKHVGAVETVAPDRLVVRAKTGTVSIDRSTILRVSERISYSSQREENAFIDGLAFSMIAAILLPFHNGSDAKFFGAMAATGTAIGAAAPTKGYHELDIYRASPAHR